jgi:dTDP-4-dehydrorhamnose reductase
VSQSSVIFRILVAGAGGRLGQVLCNDLEAAGHDILPMRRSDLDITDEASVSGIVRDAAPHIVINCAAYNAVDGAESDSAAAYAINATGPRLLAGAAARTNALFVHYSTDFVFDGMARAPYAEDDPVNPLSVYGSSKLAGEAAVRGASARYYILRVESLFGGKAVGGHRATIDYMADTLLTGTTVRAFVDRTVTPSYVPDVARATRQLIANGAPHGTYHCVNTGATNWCDIAHQIAQQLGVPRLVEGVPSSDPPGKARRPRFCALSNDRLRAVGIVMPDWQSTVTRHLAQRTPTTVASGTP